MSVGRGIESTQTVVGRASLIWAAIFSSAVCGVALPGCGPAPMAPAPSTTSASKPASTGASRESPADQERQVAVRTDAQGRKWLGDVPYDVFFDDPLAVAAEGRNEARAAESPGDAKTKGKGVLAAANPTPRTNSGTVGSAGDHDAGMPSKSVPSTEGDSSSKPAAPSADWNALIDAETLDAEVKQIRTELTAGLQSVAKYNARFQEIAVSAATLAALAEIVAEQSRHVSWKEHAGSVRDLAAAIHDSAKGLGGPAYQATKSASDQLMDVMDGNIPTGLGAAEPMRDFSQVANRTAIMKRMDRSFQRLKKGGTAQQLLKKDAPGALEDAAILAVLSRVIMVGHYDSADDPKYRGHATELTRAASDLATAAKSNEAPAFADALTRIQKRCDACHADFRF
jgi:hypothetical protein